MKSLLAAIGVMLIVTATQSQALSCMRPDVARTYGFASEADETYIVVHGKLSFNAAKLPKASGNDSPPSTKIPARFEGKYLSRSGFNKAFDRKITLDVTCLGPWCAGAATGTEYLAFLRDNGTGYTLDLDPCGGMGFPEPTPEMLNQAEQCMNGGSCKAKMR